MSDITKMQTPELYDEASRLTADNERLRNALSEIHRRTGLLLHQNIGRWRMSVEADKRTLDVLTVNQSLAFDALQPE